jgi:hypothetical protein
MKHVFLIALAFLVAGHAAAEGARTFYHFCYSKDDQGNEYSYIDFRRDEIVVSVLSDDALEFESGGEHYSAKRVPGFDLLAGGGNDIERFYARKVDEHTFHIFNVGLSGNAWTVYTANRARLDEPFSEENCQVADARLAFAQLKEAEARRAGALTDQRREAVTRWASSQVSKRKDPALENAILAWWRGDTKPEDVVNTILRISFLHPNYEFTRNDIGVVLRKTVDTLFVFRNKEKQKCFAQWRSFGYEALGGGAFSDELDNWIKRDYLGSYYYITLNDGPHIEASVDQEVDCAPFEKPG